jgi:hypothetical protein
MKKLGMGMLAAMVVLAALAGSASAGERHGGHDRHYRDYDRGYYAPRTMIIREPVRRVYVDPYPVYCDPAPLYVAPRCGTVIVSPGYRTYYTRPRCGISFSFGW